LKRILTLAAPLLALSACHHDENAVLLVVVTASGSPPAVAALEVTLTGPAGMSSNRYTRGGEEPITFPTTLSAQLPASATGGMISIDVHAEDATGAMVAAGHEGDLTLRPGERRTVYVRLDCGGNACVVDGGPGGNRDGGMPPVSPRCGNGRIDPGETCDTMIAAGDPGACPQSCDDHAPCTIDIRSGSDCTVTCAHREITDRSATDGCCPAGAVHSGTPENSDPDCSPRCDDGIVDPGETCDIRIPPGNVGACPKASDCMSDTACAIGTLVSANTCAAACARYPIVTQANGDGCCPPGATNAVDNDCVKACGNGVVEGGEKCDLGIAAPAPGACATSCDDGNACTIDFFGAAGCARSPDACQHTTITAKLSGDGCCPTGATHATDTDCPAKCGNGVIDRGEACDGASCPTRCPSAPPGCLRVDLVGEKDDCSARCVVSEVTTCVPQKDGCCPSGCTFETDGDCSRLCGDRLIETTLGEVCDIAVAPGQPDTCPVSCADASACTENRLVSPGTCAAACVFLPITSFRPGDGCCAFNAGANFTIDPDCTPQCGNGVVESPVERCDFGVDGSCPTADACPFAGYCTRYERQGSPVNCSATCVATPITACSLQKDDCCPPGCTAADDVDCPVICGDGVVEAEESCDRAITAGAPGACLRSCDDGNACTVDVGSGSTEGCTRTCIHQAITGCVNNDGCCPAGCTAGTDEDCAPVCGDGRVGAGETCDPTSTCPTSCRDDGDPCTAEQLTGTPATCTAACRHVPITACSGTKGDACCPTGCTQANDWDC
jgi:hypothetical protein